MRSFTSIPTLNQRRRLVLTHLEELDTPRSLSIFMLMKYECEDEILNLDIDPNWFLDAKAFLEFSIPSSLVKKWTDLNLSTDPEQVAREKFWAAEQQCRDSNRRIRTSFPEGRVGDIIDSARKILARILPEVDTPLLQEIGERGGWGSGSTSSCKGKWVSEYNKLSVVQEATQAFQPVAQAFFEGDGTFSALASVNVKNFNTVGFVPKNAKTHRTIAVEPSANAFFQKGVGHVLRRPLRRLGIDLRSQRKNQLYAYIGSRDGSFATIDLSSASDCISKALVELLFPEDWVSLLGLLRSPAFSIDGEIHTYHKWSSMGNGYTFELESLIFGSVVAAVCGSPSNWCVYGDDIIVPSAHFDIVAKCLEWLGFSLNREKTYSEGPFRESCGADFFQGVPVRSFFLKEWNHVTSYEWANRLRVAPVYSFFKNKKTWISLTRDLAKGPYWPDSPVTSVFVNEWEVNPSQPVLERRPFGPFIGYRFVGIAFRPETQSKDLVNGLPAVMASIREIRPLANLLDGRLKTTGLVVTARESGTWKRKSVIYPMDEWPMLCPLRG